MNPLLYGHHTDECIVAVHQLNDSLVRIYKRIEGKVTHEDVEFFPFFFLADASLITGFPAFYWIKELAGQHDYKHLLVFKRWNEMWEAVNFVLNQYNKTRRPRADSYQEVDSMLFRPDPVYQYLMQSGKTSFKGMSFRDLNRMQIDIQVYSANQRLTDSLKQHGRIVVISMSDNQRWKQQLDGRKLDEKEMLGQFIALIQEKDPDIIEGHEFFSFVLPYISQRCELLGLDLILGRGQHALKTYQKRFYSEDEFTVYDCPGRHLIDTSHLVRTYDYSKRSLDGYDLNHLSAHFQVQQSVAIPKNRVTSVWEESPEILLQYSLGNTHVIEAVSERLSPSNFYLAQMCPFGYGTVAQLGSSARLESLVLREYLRQKHSIPRPQRGAQTVGGYTDIFSTGVLENVLQADVESLYPSIMISKPVKPRTDTLEVFVPLLRELTNLRLKAKSNMKRSKSARSRSHFDAMQSAFKILINSFYGYLGYSRGLYNDYQQADVVTSTGQTILRSILKEIELFNALPIEVDTDGIFFIAPDNIRGEKNTEAFVERVSKTLPAGINLVLEGRYKKMLSYKMKNYALLDESDNLIIRGSSLISRSMERFSRLFVQRCIECLLTDDIPRLHHTYASFTTQVRNHQWEAADFCRTETVREDLETYTRLVEHGQRNVSAAYEAARNAGLYFKAGERISYYVTGTHQEVKIADNCRIADEWDSNLPDENTAYYFGRLNESADKFREFFEPEDFKIIFSLDDLFGFSPKGIRILTKKVIREKLAGAKESEENEEFGIWLSENE